MKCIQSAVAREGRGGRQHECGRQVPRASSDRDFAATFVAAGNRIIAAGKQAVAKGNHPEAVAHDVAFHSFLYEQSGNSMLATTAEPLWHYLRRVMNTVVSFAERGSVVWAEHRAILDALAQGDAESGVERVTRHITGAEAAVLGKVGDPLGVKDAGGPTPGSAQVTEDARPG